jgi:hypothetical protein
MPVGTIVPDGNIILAPLEANLVVVILRYQLPLMSAGDQSSYKMKQSRILTLKRYARITSDSSFVSSTIRLVNALFTKTLFQPVTAIEGLSNVS